MESDVLFQNEFLFGNTLLEWIPHPAGFLGNLLNILTIICHYFGGITVFIVSLPIFYFFYNSRFGIKLCMAVLSTGLINGLQKYFFMSPRPRDLSQQFIEISGFIKENSFGFPSGHAHISILVWGMIYLRFQNIYIRGTSLFFILFTPFSRLYAGVHYPGDVLGGFFTGLLSLYAIEWFFKKYPKFPDPRSWKNPEKTFKSLVLAVIAITVSTVLLDTSTQTQRGTANQIVSSAASAAGLFTGILLWKRRYENYDLEDIKWIRTLALLFLAIVSFYIGMGRISEHFFKDNEVFRYFRYFLLNFTIIYIVPYFSLVIFGEKENPT